MGLPDIGTIALMAALALCVYGTVVPHLGVRANNWNLIRSAQNASILTFFLVAIASLILINALITNDFSSFFPLATGCFPPLLMTTFQSVVDL